MPILRVCGCGAIVTATPCPACRRKRARAKLELPVQRAHYKAAHRRIRAAVLARDGYRCHWCGGPGDTVDYVVPLSRGGELSVRNAVCACRSCNSSRGGRLSGGHNRSTESRCRLGQYTS